MLGAEEIRRTE